MSSLSTVDVTVEPAEKEAWKRLQEETCPIKLQTGCFGTIRSMTKDQRNEIATIWGIDPSQIKTGTAIIDTKNPYFAKCTRCTRWASQYLKINSYPFDDRGTRLARKEFVGRFTKRTDEYQAELAQHVKYFDENVYPELVEHERLTRKERFVPELYPKSVANLFYIKYSFPSMDINQNLSRFMPELTSQMQKDIEQNLRAAVKSSYNEFAKEFKGYVDHFVEIMNSGKSFQYPTVEKIKEFSKWFTKMDVGGDEYFSSLVEKSNLILDGVDAQDIRDDILIKQAVTESMSTLKETLDSHAIDRAERSIDFWE